MSDDMTPLVPIEALLLTVTVLAEPAVLPLPPILTLPEIEEIAPPKAEPPLPPLPPILCAVIPED